MLSQWDLFPTIQMLIMPRNPSSQSWTIKAQAAERGKGFPRRSQSSLDTRISLVLALASQASSVSQRFLGDLVAETAKYVFPRRFEARTLDEALMLGFVTDEDVKQRESKLRDALRRDSQFQVKHDTFVEVSQYNPPFTLPFTRRNEIALEVEQKAD